jgi:uncharacterized protein (UPF0264 family)
MCMPSSFFGSPPTLLLVNHDQEGEVNKYVVEARGHGAELRESSAAGVDRFEQLSRIGCDSVGFPVAT